jgi:hypothetical protein
MAPARTPCQRSHSTDLTRGLLDAGWYAKGVPLFLEGLWRELIRCEALATHEPFPVRQAFIEAADLTPETKADFQWFGQILGYRPVTDDASRKALWDQHRESPVVTTLTRLARARVKVIEQPFLSSTKYPSQADQP